jgi:hypothetical protein
MNIQIILNRLREQAHLTDKAIGDELGGVPQATINRLRHGVHKKTDYERFNAIVALAEKHGVLTEDAV